MSPAIFGALSIVVVLTVAAIWLLVHISGEISEDKRMLVTAISTVHDRLNTNRAEMDDKYNSLSLDITTKLDDLVEHGMAQDAAIQAGLDGVSADVAGVASTLADEAGTEEKILGDLLGVRDYIIANSSIVDLETPIDPDTPEKLTADVVPVVEGVAAKVVLTKGAGAAKVTLAKDGAVVTKDGSVVAKVPEKKTLAGLVAASRVASARGATPAAVGSLLEKTPVVALAKPPTADQVAVAEKEAVTKSKASLLAKDPTTRIVLALEADMAAQVAGTPVAKKAAKQANDKLVEDADELGLDEAAFEEADKIVLSKRQLANKKTADDALVELGIRKAEAEAREANLTTREAALAAKVVRDTPVVPPTPSGPTISSALAASDVVALAAEEDTELEPVVDGLGDIAGDVLKKVPKKVPDDLATIEIKTTLASAEAGANARAKKAAKVAVDATMAATEAAAIADAATADALAANAAASATVESFDVGTVKTGSYITDSSQLVGELRASCSNGYAGMNAYSEDFRQERAY